MSLASVAQQQSNALAAAMNAAANPNASNSAPAGSGASSSTSGSSAATAAQAGQNALASLSNNFSTFLNMLMTQLQNQDPTSPMDSNQFTQELVEFSGVEQQINTNSSLTQLIQLTQAGELMQGSTLDGKQLTVQSGPDPAAERLRRGAIYHHRGRARGHRHQQQPGSASARRDPQCHSGTE